GPSETGAERTESSTTGTGAAERSVAGADAAEPSTAGRDAVRPRSTEVHTALLAAGELSVDGVDVAWAELWAGRTPQRVDLPSYAFQRRRFWHATTGRPVDAFALGQTAVDHPLLGAVVAVPDTGGVVVTGRLSAQTQPWLADCVVGERMTFPAGGF